MLVDFVKLLTLDINKYKTVNWNYFEIRDRVKRKGKREDVREKCGRTAWKGIPPPPPPLFLHFVYYFSIIGSLIMKY